MLKKKFWKENFEKKVLKIKILENSLRKKLKESNFGKMIWQKKFWKNKLQRKIFITKIYSNIDKCHTIFALLATFDRTGWKTGSNENVCGMWSKIGIVACSHWTQVMWRFERSRETRYNHGLRAVGNSLTTIGGTKIFSSGLPSRWSGGALSATKKSNVVHQLSYGVNHSISMALIHRL